jgi:hypothetical protein
MLKDCTEEFIRYREVCRNVWNAGFRHNAKIEIGVDHSIFYQFREIEARLFEGMVLLPLGITEPVRDRNRLSVDFSFYVTTSPNERERMVLDSPMPKDFGRWDLHRFPLQPNTYQFRFYQFFDWDVVGPRDYQYVMVIMETLKARPEFENRCALLEFNDQCQFFLRKKGRLQL